MSWVLFLTTSLCRGLRNLRRYHCPGFRCKRLDNLTKLLVEHRLWTGLIREPDVTQANRWQEFLCAKSTRTRADRIDHAEFFPGQSSLQLSVADRQCVQQSVSSELWGPIADWLRPIRSLAVRCIKIRYADCSAASSLS